MADEKMTLPEIYAYRDLDDKRRAQVDKLLEEYCLVPGSKQALIESFNEFGSEVAALISQVGSAEKLGHMKEGIWGPLMALMMKDPKALAKRRKTTRVAPVKATRGKLPFTKLPEPHETRAAFSARWLKEGKKYPADMLHWESGEINWLSAEVYNHKRGSVEWYVYLALVSGQMTYQELLDRLRDDDGNPFTQKDIDWALKCFMVEPSWLPPGAGTYKEDPERGRMWIERDLMKALEETKSFVDTD